MSGGGGGPIIIPFRKAVMQTLAQPFAPYGRVKVWHGAYIVLLIGMLVGFILGRIL